MRLPPNRQDAAAGQAIGSATTEGPHKTPSRSCLLYFFVGKALPARSGFRFDPQRHLRLTEGAVGMKQRLPEKKHGFPLTQTAQTTQINILLTKSHKRSTVATFVAKAPPAGWFTWCQIASAGGFHLQVSVLHCCCLQPSSAAACVLHLQMKNRDRLAANRR